MGSLAQLGRKEIWEVSLRDMKCLGLHWINLLCYPLCLIHKLIHRDEYKVRVYFLEAVIAFSLSGLAVGWV